ncbi:MAG: glycosyltransferase [Salinivirgaceae bacterium]|nr:glycosyltransferase [Salinivirgaceae bacterium]MDD4746581.1 glycosyltransferase [Salinivirgaceae bacterium]MDY0280384.1 glycosyltransferase [Salinivirgaceae bacterium]
MPQNNVKRSDVLYISYDGLTDPLGQSQILPYLIGLSRNGYRITVLSAEKADRFQENKSLIDSIIREHAIYWRPIFYTKRPPIIATLYDLRKMFKVAHALQKHSPFDIVHCRSYISAMVGMSMKKQFGVRFLFDMRGFWADERVDGGVWRLSNPIFNAVYTYFKKREKQFFENADHVVSLTESGKNTILKEITPTLNSSQITIIPCCADLDHFIVRDDYAESKTDWLKKLTISSDSFVLTYLGSVGTWYLVEEMLQFFNVLKTKFKPNAVFLFITKDNPKTILDACANLDIESSSIRIIQSGRDELPTLLSISNASVSFIKPSFSKRASSPTKLAELFGLGIPVFSNSGVGDIDEYYKSILPFKVNSFSEASFFGLWDYYFKNLPIDTQQFVKIAHQYFSLEKGVAKYATIYENL